MKVVIDIPERDYEFIKSVRSIMKNSDTFQRIATDLFMAVQEAEVSEVTHMITTKEFLDACKVINTYCKEQHCQCATCPMLGVCRVGVPNVDSDIDIGEDEVD